MPGTYGLTRLDRWKQYVVDVGDGCWEWQGTKGRLGYGVFRWDTTKRTGAHRAGYMLLRGEIPEGMELDHLCRNPGCVRPDHMEPVTHRENARRGEQRSGVRTTRGAWTHCKAGHRLVLNARSGERWCSTCRREYCRKWAAACRARKRAA